MAKILLVEDDPLLIDMYAKAFRFYGYETETAFNGQEALQKLDAMEKKPTLVLSDVMMPMMNGVDLLKMIKQSGALKAIPVVMLTNLAGERDAQEALLHGAVTYLVKSQYEPKEIVDKIREILAGYDRNTNVPEVKVPIKDLHPEQ